MRYKSIEIFENENGYTCNLLDGSGKIFVFMNPIQLYEWLSIQLAKMKQEVDAK